MKKDARTSGVPPRVAPRLEGKVKNVGIKPKRKHKRERKESGTSDTVA